MRTLIRLCAVLVAVHAAVACSASPTSGAQADVATFKVMPRDLRIAITEKGALKTTRQISIRPEIPGTAKIVWLVDEGAEVKAGDVVCELDRTDKVKEVEDLQNRVIQLQSQLTAAQAELEIQVSQNEADVSDAELKHHFAEVELERFEKAEYVQERTKREVRVEETKSELARATKRYDQMPALKDEGFVTPEQVEEERIRKVKAESDLRLALLDLDAYDKYSAPKERETKQAEVRSRKLEVERARQRAMAREAQKRADAERQRNELANVRTTYEKAKAVLDKMTIRAPANGTILYGDPRAPWESRTIKVGEMAYSGRTILTLPDLSEMQCLVTIHEADIARIKPSQKAFVVVESATQVQFEGEVTRVAQVATRDWESYDRTKRFEVEITLRGDTSRIELKPGMTARVEILVGERSGVLAVPVQAVFAQPGQFFVFKRQGDVASRREVRIEDGNAQFVIVTAGLEQGDEILLMNPEANGESGTTATAGPVPGPAPQQSTRGKP